MRRYTRKWARSTARSGQGCCDRAASLQARVVPNVGPDASLKALAADAGIDVVVASRTVADMHSRGLVDKRRSPGNKRLVCLRLTDDGVQIHGKAKLMAAAYNR